MIFKDYTPSADGRLPQLNGLILAGGRSSRLGKDKSQIQWHGKPQVYYTADLLKGICQQVFISCRPEQQNLISSDYATIADNYKDLGPYGAILSAFDYNSDCAWLVVACDLPLLDIETIFDLVEQRDGELMATAFESPQDGLPEPLIAIWEPKSREMLIASLKQPFFSLRKLLSTNDVKIIRPKKPDALINVNTTEDEERAKNILHNLRQTD